MADVTCDRCQAPLSPGQPLCACGQPVPRGRRRHRQAKQPETQSHPMSADTDSPPASRMPEQPSAAAGRADAVEPPGEVGGRSERASCTHEQLPPGLQLCDCGTFLGSPRPDHARAGGVVLELPWGEHRLAAGEVVEIGREVGPFQRQLNDRTSVSRRHASLRLTARGVLLLQDHASMNGTFVDEMRCPPTGEIEVADGSEVRCSSMLRIQVRFE